MTRDAPNGELVRAHPDGTAPIVRAVSRAASSCLMGLAGGVLRVRVAAPAVEGKGTRRCCRSWLAGWACAVGAAPGGGERGREKVVVIGGRTLRRSGPRSAWPSTRGSHRLGWRGPPDREAGAFSVTACFVRSTTRSMFYLALPGLTLTTGFPELRCLYRTTLALRPPSDYGSGGWGFESLAARQTRRSDPIKQEKLDRAFLAMAVLPISAVAL